MGLIFHLCIYRLLRLKDVLNKKQRLKSIFRNYYYLVSRTQDNPFLSLDCHLLCIQLVKYFAVLLNLNSNY